MKKLFSVKFFVPLSILIVGGSVFGTYYLISEKNRNSSIKKFTESFRDSNTIETSQTTLEIVPGMVRLFPNRAKEIANFLRDLPDFARVRAVATDGKKFLVAAESYYQAGTHPIIAEYENGQWRDVTDRGMVIG
ncbi:MAG: hypothetical protein A3C85_01885 [Candidatus Doudnabacteria bacterium RIFCSPHIGHO2_02_FULL_48_21]|nr:MAG: hypothetical protein A3K05_02090 [Candidatus Doudnabacteria bacterium RIFCSPHIGHO2_01_48_18]OGE78036.1 MAG: hypothetical protein A2668_03635 [Candidatus Doudnabacteria bacterium RIFCSPHIGHO2_01_FULL_48_180]OGE91365.1 MAG: hypothetical protein A3F44_03640 [Candidatus Doudnabacteria bacterium RIFCSPHIGHO2_12_FULL_47_25]OGE93177.1 MAG: hypothetical protein A3C85_01885 [Candidatus Doudnabacteria bacterium RIFCSPHIGHO2_02_FULL_48_21]OGE96698.1 MAG: hypothetical protein A3A83_02760 [Candidatu